MSRPGPWIIAGVALAALFPLAGPTGCAAAGPVAEDPVAENEAAEKRAAEDRAASDRSTSPLRLDVVFLANESFLVRVGDTSVLIDAFVREPHLRYSAVPDSVLARMAAAEPPFEDVVLALVSDVDPDDHQTEVAREYFAARPEVALISSPQVMARTFPARPGESADAERPDDEAVLPAPGKSVVRELRGVTVEFLGLPHGGASADSVEHLGHLIGIGGRQVLHVGNAAMDRKTFAALDLPSRRVDVALVPYWYLRTKDGRAFLDEYIRAEWYVACHVPPEELAEVTTRLGMRMPDVRVPRRPLETLHY